MDVLSFFPTSRFLIAVTGSNSSHVNASAKLGDHDFHLHVIEFHNAGPTTTMTLAAFVALCSGILGKPGRHRLVILGSMSLGGNIIPVQSLADSLQVAFDASAKRLLLPMSSVSDIPTIPGELFAKFQTSFYADPRDAVFKALGLSERDQAYDRTTILGLTTS